MNRTVIGAAGIFVGGLLIGGALGYAYKEKHTESFVTAGGEFLFPVADFDCSIIFDEESEQQVYLLESNLMYADDDDDDIEYEEIGEISSVGVSEVNSPYPYEPTHDDIEHLRHQYKKFASMYDRSNDKDGDELPFDEDESHADVIDLDADNEKLIESDGKDILVIPMSEMGTHEFYETEMLTYYAPNDLLVDNRDEVVHDRSDVIGDGLDHFGEESGDPDVVYIRNHNHQCDYEIIREHAPWDLLEVYDV